MNCMEKNEWLNDELEPTYHNLYTVVNAKPSMAEAAFVGNVKKGVYSLFASRKNDCTFHNEDWSQYAYSMVYESADDLCDKAKKFSQKHPHSALFVDATDMAKEEQAEFAANLKCSAMKCGYSAFLFLGSDYSCLIESMSNTVLKANGNAESVTVLKSRDGYIPTLVKEVN